MADSADVAGDKIERQPRAALGYDICLQWPEGEVRTPPAEAIYIVMVCVIALVMADLEYRDRRTQRKRDTGARRRMADCGTWRA